MYSKYLNSCNFDIKQCYLEFVYSVLLNGNLLNHLDKVSSYGIQNILYSGYRFGIKMILSFATLLTVGLSKTNKRICEINSTREYFQEFFNSCDYGDYKQYYDIGKSAFDNDVFADFSEMCRNDKYTNVFGTYKNAILNNENENENVDEFIRFSALCLTDMTTLTVNKMYDLVFDTNCKINQPLMEKINLNFVNGSTKYFEDLQKLDDSNFDNNYEEQLNKSGLKNIISLCKMYYNKAFDQTKSDFTFDQNDIDVEMRFGERNINVNTYNNDTSDEINV
jgi:hypothetical protein